MLKLENGREVLFSGRVDNASVPWITDNIRNVIEVGRKSRALIASPAPPSWIRSIGLARQYHQLPCQGKTAVFSLMLLPAHDHMLPLALHVMLSHAHVVLKVVMLYLLGVAA